MANRSKRRRNGVPQVVSRPVRTRHPVYATAIVSVSLILAVMVVGAWWYHRGPGPVPSPPRDLALERAVLHTIAPLGADEIATLRTHLNPSHLASATRFGVGPVATRDWIPSLMRQRRLMPLSTNRLFRVMPMDYGTPHLTPVAHAMLLNIGERFHAMLDAKGLPPYRFRVTSALRSVDDQIRLRGGGNRNAAARSSHCYGTTVDILYRVFEPPYSPSVAGPSSPKGGLDPVSTDAPRIAAILGRVLIALQAAGDLIVIYERRQPVFHVTVARGFG